MVLPSFLAGVGDEFGEKTQPYSLPSASIAPFLRRLGERRTGPDRWRRVTPGTVAVLSERSTVVAIMGPDEFFGEGCLAGQPRRIATATALTDCEIMRLEKGAIIRVLHDEPAFSEMFVSHLLARTIRVEADLVDQLFNSSEKRLARALLLLANFGKEGRPEPIIAKVSQETLAEMIGTTRSRVSHFMNKFRELGFIDYNGQQIGSPQLIVERGSARSTAD